MAQKKSKKKSQGRFVFVDAPITLCICLSSIAIYALEANFFDGNYLAIFSSPQKPFLLSHFTSYLRLFLHILGHTNLTHLCFNVILLLLLAPSQEQKYSRTVFCIMIFVCSFVSGILFVVFGVPLVRGLDGVAFLLILLSAFDSIQKQAVSSSVLLLVCVFVVYVLVDKNLDSAQIASANAVLQNPNSANESVYKGVASTMQLLGGICASLFGLISPVKPERKKKSTLAKQSASAQSTQAQSFSAQSNFDDTDA